MPPRQWNLRARARECALTGRTFLPGETFYTAIFLAEKSEDIVRQDFALDAWEQRDATQPVPFSLWKSVCQPPAPSTQRPEVVPKATAESLLRELMDDPDPQRDHARYILALMLERKKLLKPKAVRDTEGGRLLFYEHAKTGDVFVIRDPQLHLAELGSIQEEVSEWLRNGAQDSIQNQALAPGVQGDLKLGK